MPQMTDAYEWQGRTVIGKDGEKIGTVKDVYTDYQTGKPEWATVSSGLFGMKSHFVPLTNASPTRGDIQVPVTTDQVKNAPAVDANGETSEREEQRLFEHYGLPYTTEGSTTAREAPAVGRTAEGYDTSGPTTDDAMTRSEEELRVGTARQERGRARLRKSRGHRTGAADGSSAA